MSMDERCSMCGSTLRVRMRGCVNKHRICDDCWDEHVPRVSNDGCPACDALIEEGHGR